MISRMLVEVVDRLHGDDTEPDAEVGRHQMHHPEADDSPEPMNGHLRGTDWHSVAVYMYMC